MKHDSWKRPIVKESVYDLTTLKQGELSLLNNTVKEATNEELETWYEEDFFMKGDFSAMQLFVVVPAVIQVTVFFMMLGMFFINEKLF